MRKLGLVIPLFMAFALAPALSHAQSSEAFAKALHWEAKLDVYQARDATTPNPTLIYFHGGGWVAGRPSFPSSTWAGTW